MVYGFMIYGYLWYTLWDDDGEMTEDPHLRFQIEKNLSTFNSNSLISTIYLEMIHSL